MEHSSAQNSSAFARSTQSAIQQSSTNSPQFARVASHPKFAITAESMAMDLPSDNIPANRERNRPLVEVKSYQERHNNQSMVKMLVDCRPEPERSFHSAPSSTATPSLATIKRDSIYSLLSHNANNEMEYHAIQTPSPSASPKSPSHQQWNFECHTSTKLNEKLPSGNNNFMKTFKTAGDVSEPDGTLFYKQQMQQRRSGSDLPIDNSVQLNFKVLNEVYATRIKSIDETAWGDKDLKIFTYQEWIDILTKINESFINNMEDLEREVESRLNFVQKRVNSNCRYSQGNELMKCRKDIDTLLKYIRNGRNSNEWSLQGWTFETIIPSQLLGEYDAESGVADEVKNVHEPDDGEKNKLFANMKALAHEVAEKHDEIRDLKRQIICLEDEIQKAQKKIQLKDDVIKELRNDLKCANNKFSVHQPIESRLPMRPTNFEQQVSHSDSTQLTDNIPNLQIDNGSQFDSLSCAEFEEKQAIKILNEEISELCTMTENLSKQSNERPGQRIMEIIGTQQSENAAVYRKLYFIRQQLTNLESSPADNRYECDSGFHSKDDDDSDAKLVDGVRKRVCKLNEMNCELQKRIQKLEFDQNELSNHLQSEKSFSERNTTILKEIADLLSILTGKQFSYTEIYSKTVNPFCVAIRQMKRDFEEKERILLSDLRKKNQEKEELTRLLLSNEKDINEDEKQLDIDIESTTLLSTPSQTRAPQVPPDFLST